MQKRSPKFPINLWTELILSGIVSWFITKILDYIYVKTKSRIKPFKGLVLMRRTGYYLLQFSLEPMIADFDQSETFVRNPFYLSSIKSILESHMRGHKRDTIKACQICRIINKHKAFLQYIFPNPELYPPFKY
jgi:hypothetical protein